MGLVVGWSMDEELPCSDGQPYRKTMRRQERPGSPDVRFLTFSCDQRRPFFEPLARDGAGRLACEAFVAALARARARHGFELFAWVVMPEHVHLLVRPAVGRVWATIASAIKNPVGKFVLPAIRHERGEAIARFWLPGGGFDRTERTIEEFSKAVKYIHLNPVKRGLVVSPQEWGWSSHGWWASGGKVRPQGVECDPPPGKIDWGSWRGYE